jgi:hypothetical protein
MDAPSQAPTITEVDEEDVDVIEILLILDGGD